SPDNNLLAYGVDNVSRRQYTLHFKNLQTGELLRDAIRNTDGKAVWADDSKTAFYTAKNPVTLLSEKVKRHQLHTDPALDAVVYEEKDNTNYISVSRAKSGKYIFIRSAGTLSSEIRMVRSDRPLTDFKVFQPRMK